ncbi:MAG TPA: DUF2459 domain-containing protein [Steroidobacteraceae bacterium]|nr:DUF2459 domain-containing protein [Steroidobacteraceae bacterium]
MKRLAPAILIGCAILCGCSSSAERAASGAERSRVVYIVRRAHHTGVAIAVADWPNRDWSVLPTFPQARYLEFGWGDAAYYQEPDPTLSMTIAAVFWPTPTVMEVVPWQVVAEGVEDSETVALRVSDSELQAIAKSIDDSFVQPISATGSSYRVANGRALFYHARGKFHMFRMCNRWTAERLQLVGCSVRPRLVMTGSQAIAAAKRCEAATQPPGSPPTR